MRRFLGLCLFLALFIPNAYAATSKPNILVIWGDDIGVAQHQRLQPRHHGLPDAQHRPHRQRRRDVHRLPTPSRAAPPGARRSFSASTRSAPVC